MSTAVAAAARNGGVAATLAMTHARCHRRATVSPNVQRPSRYVAANVSRGGMSERARREYGPLPPPPPPSEEEAARFNDEPSEEALRAEELLGGENGETPEWVQNIIEAAEVGDPEYVKLLEGTDNDPVKIMKNVTKALGEMKQSQPRQPAEAKVNAAQMRIRFREVDHFNLWIWIRLLETPTMKERQLVSEVLKSWFTMGRLTAFNGMNLQLFEMATADLSYFNYDHDQLETGLTSSFHEMSEPEFKDNWCRVWLDTGTADEFSFDMLINAFNGFNREHAAVTDLIFGGENPDWPTPEVRYNPLSQDFIPQSAEAFKDSPNSQVPGYELEELGNMDDLDKYMGGFGDVVEDDDEDLDEDGEFESLFSGPKPPSK